MNVNSEVTTRGPKKKVGCSKFTYIVGSRSKLDGWNI